MPGPRGERGHEKGAGSLAGVAPAAGPRLPARLKMRSPPRELRPISATCARQLPEPPPRPHRSRRPGPGLPRADQQAGSGDPGERDEARARRDAVAEEGPHGRERRQHEQGQSDQRGARRCRPPRSKHSHRRERGAAAEPSRRRRLSRTSQAQLKVPSRNSRGRASPRRAAEPISSRSAGRSDGASGRSPLRQWWTPRRSCVTRSRPRRSLAPPSGGSPSRKR